ncbi:hypothetical protein B0H16DRAFT_1465361 [Mycena metata]|uniref:Uncharacterized protein n=1 Tax=Mycena metata TaxID=1033252 RepID=A0AAD7IBH5_9AGAR|nr:hypothetical protein B0H16DRAFT_1465361 [Mycena metata]
MSFNSNIILGALLVGTWANSVLYTLEVIQLLVLSALAIDSVSMIATYTSVYLVLYNHSLGKFGVSGEPVLGRSFRSYSKKHNRTHVIEKPDPLYLFTTGVVTALVQSFLTVRYWLLTKNKFITLTLFVFITVATAGAFASGVTIAISPGYKDRAKATIPATIWLVSEAVTDISIASALLWEFRKVKTSFKEMESVYKTGYRRHSDLGFFLMQHHRPDLILVGSLRDRLMAQTIQTGAAGATVAMAVLIA